MQSRKNGVPALTFPALEEVVEKLRELSEAESIDPDEPIESLPVDSIDLLEWIIILEDDYGVVVDDSKFEAMRVRSIRELYTSFESEDLTRPASDR